MTHSLSRSRKFDPFRLLLESVRQYAICTLDLNGFILTWNAGMRQLNGYTAQEAVGTHFSKFFTPQGGEIDEHVNLLSQAVRHRIVEDDVWVRRKDGSRFRAHHIIMTLHEESGSVRGFGVLTREVFDDGSSEVVQLVERRLHEEIAGQAEQRTSELSRIISQLEKANRLKDDFLAMASHELLTPLTSAVGWVNLIRNGRVPEEKVGEALEVIYRNLSAQKDLIQDLLNVSRIVSGKLTIHPEPVNPALIVLDTVESLRPSLDSKQLRIDLALESDMIIEVDPIRFQQIFWNLLTNAVKFTPSGGSIHVLLKRTEDQATLTVSDTGAGIASEFLPFVFDRFRQAALSATRPAGLGLGLSIVRHLVELHGGTVSASSEGHDKGSTFSVLIPMPRLPSPGRNLRVLALHLN